MSTSSSSPRNWRYNVFTSFHGPDVRQGFLSHLRQQFTYNGITMFDDNGIERSKIIAPALTQGIRDSRISIILLSKKYASSSWCLDELLEILECKKNMGQKVMTIFYGVDPSDVRHQAGDFGMAFSETCDRIKENRIKWSEALTYVGNIAGEDFKNWDNEAKMIEKIARDVSGKLNATASRDFQGIVGLEGHFRKMECLLNSDNVGVKMVGISGPAGIGKSTIARALHCKLSNSFQHTCFMNNLKGSYNSGLDKYGLQLYLQEQLLSKVLNLEGIRISHLGVIKERLQDQKILIILDDVESLDQLEALANDFTWFGPGSRVIVTTENKEILEQHYINDIYEVDFPSKREARQIFCLSTFRQTFPPNEFLNLADEVVRICGNLPLGLHVLGSSLRGKSEAEWIDELPRLKDSLDGKIESVLKVGYESLNEKDQALFLHIAVFFNYQLVDHVTSMFVKSNFDVRPGLTVLAKRNLIHIDRERRVVMHRLLQVMARQVISKQEPLKRQILVDANEICEVLESAGGNRSTVGVSFDVAEIDELMINAKAFEKLRNLFFLKISDGRCSFDCNECIPPTKLHIPEEMEFPRRIRLFHWDKYPGKSLHRFCPENLVEINMEYSQLERLWEGRQPLANLKELNLSMSSRLKKLPDLSNATNLETLNLFECISLVELPSSIANFHKMCQLSIWKCKSLEVVPTLANLTSLKHFEVYGCSQLRRFPDIPHNFHALDVRYSGVEELPASLMHCHRLELVEIRVNKNLKTFSTYLPTSVTKLDLTYCGIERITDCIKGLHNLKELDLSGCEKLESLPELPDSLEILNLRRCKRLVSLPELPSLLKELRACDCESLERVSGHLSTPKAKLDFTNCLKLDRQAPKTIIQQLFACGFGCAFLPGREVPAEFDHRATGNSLTIPHSAFNRFKVCVVISYKKDYMDIGLYYSETQLPLQFYIEAKGYLVKHYWTKVSTGTENAILFRGTKHLIIFDCELPFLDPSEVSREIKLKFRSGHQKFSIIECGVQILSVETDRSNYSGLEDRFESCEASSEEEDDETDGSDNGGFGDIYDKIFGSLYEPKASDEPEEDDDSIIANGRSETEFCDKEEDNEEGYKSDYGEASKDNDKDIVDEATNGQKEDDDERYKSDYGEASKDFSFRLIKRHIADDGDSESVSRKRPKIFHFF